MTDLPKTITVCGVEFTGGKPHSLGATWLGDIGRIDYEDNARDPHPWRVMLRMPYGVKINAIEKTLPEAIATAEARAAEHLAPLVFWLGWMTRGGQ